jgi:hypothetical protein
MFINIVPLVMTLFWNHGKKWTYIINLKIKNIMVQGQIFI